MTRPRAAGTLVLLWLPLALGTALAEQPAEPAAPVEQAEARPASPAGAGDAQGAASATGLTGSFRALVRAYYGPLTDAHRGRLYEATADLLNSGRELPDAIDLGVPRRPAAAAQAQPGAPAEQPPAQPEPAAESQRPRWVEVLNHPVVGEEDLAHAYFLAGSYAESAAAYRRLRERNPDDAHLLLMLLLSERNAGNAAEARSLLAELQKKGPEAAKWAEWLTAMMDLSEAKQEAAP